MAGRHGPSSLISTIGSSNLCRVHPRLTSHSTTVRLTASAASTKNVDFSVRHFATETSQTPLSSAATSKRPPSTGARSKEAVNVETGTECSAPVGVSHDRRRNIWSCTMRVEGKVARITVPSSATASLLSDLWRIAVRGAPEAWAASSPRALNVPDHPRVLQALQEARDMGKPRGMTHAKALELGSSLLQQLETAPQKSAAGGPPAIPPVARQGTPPMPSTGGSHKRARPHPAGVIDLEPWMADDLLEFLDVFALPSCKSRVEAQLLHDCLRAEAGQALRKEGHGMEWGLRQPAKHSPRVLDLGLSTRLLAAYGADARVAPHKHGIFRVDRSDPLQWLQAVHAASPSLRLAEMEAQLLDLRVCHAFLHPQHTEDAWQLPVHMNKLQMAGPEPRNARTRAELSALHGMLARFPAPQPLTKGATYVSMSQSLLARFNVTEGSHPVLWTRLRLYARVHAYILALVLNRPVVLYWAEQLRLWDIARLNPQPAAPAASSTTQHNDASNSADAEGILSDSGYGAPTATSTRLRIAELKGMVAPPHSTGRPEETPFALLCPSMPQGVTRYLSQVRRVLMACKLLESGPLPGMQSAASSWWVSRVMQEMPDVEAARTGLLTLPLAPLSSRVAPLYGPLVAAYLGDVQTAAQAATNVLPLATACAVETAQHVLQTSTAQPTAGSVQARTAESLQHLIRDGRRAMSKSDLSSVVPGTVLSKGEAPAAVVYDPLSVLPSLHKALGLPQEVVEGMKPPAVLNGMHEVLHSQPAADFYRVIKSYRTTLRASVGVVRHAPAQVKVQLSGGTAEHPRDHLRRQLEGEIERQKSIKEKQLPHYPLLEALLHELRGVTRRQPKSHQALLQLARDIEAEGLKQLRDTLTAQFGRWWSEEASQPSQLESSISHKLAAVSVSGRPRLTSAAKADGIAAGKRKTFGPASEVEQLLELRNKYHAVRLHEESARVHVHALMSLLPHERLSLLYKPVCMGALAYLRPRHLLEDPVLEPLMVEASAVREQRPVATVEGGDAAASADAGVGQVAGAAASHTPAKKLSVLARLQAMSSPSVLLTQWSKLTNEALLMSRVLTNDSAPLARKLPGSALATAAGLGLHSALPQQLQRAAKLQESGHPAGAATGSARSSAGSVASAMPASGQETTSVSLEGSGGYDLEALYQDVTSTVARLEKLQQLPWDVQEAAAGFVPAFMPNYWAGSQRDAPAEVLDPRARVLGWVLRLAFLLTEKDFMHVRNQVAYLTQCLASDAAGNAEIAKPGTTPFVTSFPCHRHDGGSDKRVTLAVGVPLSAPSSGQARGPTFHKALRDARAAFGPLGYLLDDPFIHLLKRGWLTANLFDAARLLVLKQYAATALQTKYWMGLEKEQRSKHEARSPRASSTPSLAQEGSSSDADVITVEDGGGGSGVAGASTSGAAERGLLADEAAEQLVSDGGSAGDSTDSEAVHALGMVPSLPALHVLHTLGSVSGLVEAAMHGAAEETTSAGGEDMSMSEQERAELEAYAAEARALDSHLTRSKVEHEIPGADISWTREEVPWRIARIRANMDKLIMPVGADGTPLLLPTLDPETHKLRNLVMPLAVFQRTVRSVAMPLRVRADRRRRHFVRVKADGTPQSFEYNTLPDVVARTVFLQKLPMIGTEVVRVPPRSKGGPGGSNPALQALEEDKAFAEPSQMLEEFTLDASDVEDDEGEAEEEREVSLGRSTPIRPLGQHHEHAAGGRVMLPIGKFITSDTVYNVMNSVGAVEHVQVHWPRSRTHMQALEEWLTRKALASDGGVSGRGRDSKGSAASWMSAPSAEELRTVQAQLEALAASERLVLDHHGGDSEAEDTEGVGTDARAEKLHSWEDLGERADTVAEHEELESSVSSLFGFEDEPEDAEDGVSAVAGRRLGEDMLVEGEDEHVAEDNSAYLPALNGVAWNGTGQSPLLNGSLNGHRTGSTRSYSTFSLARHRHSLRARSAAPHSILTSMSAQAKVLQLGSFISIKRAASSSSASAGAEGESLVGHQGGQQVGARNSKGAGPTRSTKKPEEPVEPKLRRSQLLQRLRRFNQASDLHAFVRFRTDEPMAVVTSESMRHFGVSVGGQSVTIVPAAEARALYVTGLPEGLTHDAACVLLHDILEKWGLKCTLDHKTLDSAKGGSAVLPTAHRHNVLLNAAGEAVVLLDTHQDAIRAAALLKRVCLPTSSTSSSAMSASSATHSGGGVAAGAAAAQAHGQKDGQLRGSGKGGNAASAKAAIITGSSSAVDGDEEDFGLDSGAGGKEDDSAQGEMWRKATPPGMLTVGWATLEEAKLRGMSRPERYLPSTR